MRVKAAFVKMFKALEGFDIEVKSIRFLDNCYQISYVCNGGLCSLFVSKVKDILNYMGAFTKDAGEAMKAVCSKLGIKAYFPDMGVAKLITEKGNYEVFYSPFHDRWMLQIYNPVKSVRQFVSFAEAVQFAMERNV
jgi:hypothetical protein